MLQTLYNLSPQQKTSVTSLFPFKKEKVVRLCQ